MSGQNSCSVHADAVMLMNHIYSSSAGDLTPPPFLGTATITSSSENDDRSGSSLEWSREGSLRDGTPHGPAGAARMDACSPVAEEDLPGAGGGPSRVEPLAGVGVAAFPAHTPSSSLVMPRPNSVAGEWNALSLNTAQ